MPSAVQAEANLPAEMAQRLRMLENEKKQRLCTTRKVISSPNTFINSSFAKYVRRQGNFFLINGEGQYQIYDPLMRITNSSYGHETIKSGKIKSFNKKKDYIQNAYIDSNQRIKVVTHDNALCDMQEFVFDYDSAYFTMNANQLILRKTPIDIMLGECPINHEVRITHIPTGWQYTYKIELYFRDQLSLSSRDGAYVIASLGSDVLPDAAILCDMQKKEMQIVHLPLTINGDGADGKDGSDGLCGMNGTNELHYTDKNGKEHYVKGTCGSVGQNGGNGGNGGDGGNFLVCISEQMYEQHGLRDVVILTKAGKGGKGGKAGLGGKNGKGSGCPEGQRAQSGKPGKDGVNGTEGNYMIVVADTEQFFNTILF